MQLMCLGKKFKLTFGQQCQSLIIEEDIRRILVDNNLIELLFFMIYRTT